DRREIDTVFRTIQREDPGALLVGSDAIFTSGRQRIVELATQLRIPSMYGWREFVEVGGFMSYGTSLPDLYRRAATYVDKILKGFDLQLTQYDERGWRATCYTTGREHSPTSATGTGWQRTPWRAVQSAPWEGCDRPVAMTRWRAYRNPKSGSIGRGI